MSGPDMNGPGVSQQGMQGERPGRQAYTGVATGRDQETRRRRGGRGEQPMVPDAKFRSYYGKPVINSPVWEAPDIPGYLFLGGLAGGASLLGAGAQLTGRHELSRVAKAGAFGAGVLSVVALVHDLGRPERFLNMLRVFKPTSPMSVGSWLLAGYVPAAGVAAMSALTGRWRALGALATAGATVMAPGVASYTAALVSDTAVPAWHDGYPEMPFVFVGSGATAAGGLGLAGAPRAEAKPARRLATFGVATELGAAQWMEKRIGMAGEPYHQGKGGLWMRVGKYLSVAGLAASYLCYANTVVRKASGVALLAASAATRFGIYYAGLASSDDPKYTVVPQRERLQRKAAEGAGG